MGTQASKLRRYHRTFLVTDAQKNNSYYYNYKFFPMEVTASEPSNYVVSLGPEGSILTANQTNTPSNRSRHSSRNTMTPLKSASRASINSILDQQNPKTALLSSNTLLNQKEQMKSNNEELEKYMKYRRNLERRIKAIEKENADLRKERQAGVTPKAKYQPKDHKKQKIVNHLHEEIVKSQERSDQITENI